MREYQSFSSLNTYMRCGMQYYFRYCEGIKTPPAVALIQGSSLHKAQELNMRQKVESFADLPASDVVDCAATEFEARAGDVEEWEVERGEAKDQLVDIARLAVETFHPTVQPIDVEAEYTVKCGEQNMKVIIDIIDDAGAVRDTKMVGKTRTQAEADNDLQLSIYSWATRLPQVAFDCHVKTKVPKIVTVRSTRTPEQWQRVEHIVPAIIEGIRKEVFLPADPTSWICTPRFCGFWHICKYGGKK